MLRIVVMVWETLTYPILTLIKPARVGVACLVVDAEDRVLMVRQTYRNGWHLPGGGVNRRECLPDGAIRETWEETGVVIDGPLDLWGVYTNIGPRYTDHIAVYLARQWHRVPKKSFEIAETAFFPLDALPDGIPKGIRYRLEELAGRRPRTHWWARD
ncbi:MAG: NUDIX domain-containing protein [Alphaproteobacteria bacterium]